MLDTKDFPQIAMEPVVIEPETQTEPTTPMLPGEAIRIGRLSVPLKCNGRLIVRKPSGDPIAACALGAMAIGYGDSGANGDQWWPDSIKPFETAYPCDCYKGGTKVAIVSSVTAHINDYHIAVPKPQQTWNEQKLANWLDAEVTAHLAK